MAAVKYSRYYTYIKPVIENKTVKSSAPYIFSLVTITIFIMFAIRPTISTIVNLQKSVDDNKKVLASLEEKAKNLSEGKNNLDNLDPQVKLKIATALPQQPDITTLIRSLNNITANTASISALQIQPINLIDAAAVNQKAFSGLGEVEFSYNIQGSFNQLLVALDNLNKAPRLLNIGTIIMNKQANGPIVLSVTGKAYYLK